MTKNKCCVFSSSLYGTCDNTIALRGEAIFRMLIYRAHAQGAVTSAAEQVSVSCQVQLGHSGCCVAEERGGFHVFARESVHQVVYVKSPYL